MNKELLEKVRADIEKTGFGSEMHAMKVFLDAGWGCKPGKGYFDQDEQKTREIDLAVHRSVHDWTESSNILFEYHVLAEVRKSERPWIVFTHDVSPTLGEGWSNPSIYRNLPCSASEISPLLAETSTRRGIPWMGYGVHEAFKNPNEPSRWYSAAVHACKACADDLTHEAYSDETLKGFGSGTFLVLSNPIVILDGTLIRAWLDSGAQLQLEEIELAPLEFDFRTRNLKHDSYRLDIVTLNGLSSFIDRTNERVDKIYELLRARKHCEGA